MFQIIWPTVSFSQRVRLSVSIIIIQLLCTQLQEKSLASFATVKNEIEKKKFLIVRENQISTPGD